MAMSQAAAVRAFLDQVVIGMALVDDDSVVVAANRSLCHLLGVTCDQIQGRSLSEFADPEDVALRLAHQRGTAWLVPDSTRQRRLFIAASGRYVWADVWVSPSDPDDARLSLVQVVDVTAEVQALDSLQRSVLRFRLLAENASDVVYQTDRRGVIEWVSPSVSDVLGWDPDLLVGTPASALMAPEDLARLTGSHAGVIRGVREHGVLAQFLTVRGGRRWMTVSAKPVLGHDDDVTGTVVSLRDVTSEQEAHEELALSQQRFRLAIDATPQGMALTDEFGRVIDVNPAAAQILGVPRDSLIGLDLSAVIKERAGECDTGERHEHTRHESDGQVWFDHSMTPVTNDVGERRYVVHQFIDETSDRWSLQELEHRASHDVLTGVANRRALVTHLDGMLAARRKADVSGRVGVLFCDVDNLKRLNDTYGHQVGDAILIRIAERLARHLRHDDRVARFGGDEFVILLDVSSRADLLEIAEKARSAVARPMDVGGHSVRASVSIGGAIAAPGEGSDAVLARADRALYRAKAAGRNRVEVSDSEDGD